MKTLTMNKAETLRDFLKKLNAENWGCWPATETWPDFDLDYGATQFDDGHNGTFTMIKFARAVALPNGEFISSGVFGKRFSVGRFVPEWAGENMNFFGAPNPPEADPQAVRKYMRATYPNAGF